MNDNYRGNNLYIIKIGGSLIKTKNRDLLQRIAHKIEGLSQENTLIILTGGGDSADLVRDYDNNFNLSAGDAHFAAIVAMEQNAYVIRSFFNRTEKLERIRGFNREKTADNNLPYIFFPIKYYIDKDPLAHSWEITSDSIALDLAGRFPSNLLILLKSTRIPEDITNTDLVDNNFINQLQSKPKYGRDCWLINGNYPDRLKELLATGTTKGYKITY